jgi:hypothetical protein
VSSEVFRLHWNEELERKFAAVLQCDPRPNLPLLREPFHITDPCRPGYPQPQRARRWQVHRADRCRYTKAVPSKGSFSFTYVTM